MWINYKLSINTYASHMSRCIFITMVLLLYNHIMCSICYIRRPHIRYTRMVHNVANVNVCALSILRKHIYKCGRLIRYSIRKKNNINKIASLAHLSHRRHKRDACFQYINKPQLVYRCFYIDSHAHLRWLLKLLSCFFFKHIKCCLLVSYIFSFQYTHLLLLYTQQMRCALYYMHTELICLYQLYSLIPMLLFFFITIIVFSNILLRIIWNCCLNCV